MTTFDRAAVAEYLAMADRRDGADRPREGTRLLRAALAELDRVTAENAALKSTVAMTMEPPELMTAAVDAQRRADGYAKKLVELEDIAARLRADLAAVKDKMARLRADRDAAVGVLKAVAAWELPPSGHTKPDGTPLSYGYCYGSNGERDYFKQLAAAVLAGAEGASR